MFRPSSSEEWDTRAIVYKAMCAKYLARARKKQNQPSWIGAYPPLQCDIEANKQKSKSVQDESQLQGTGTETTTTGAEKEPNGESGHEDYLEEFVYNLMGKTGLLSKLQSPIARFLQKNGEIEPGVSVIPSRAHPMILEQIFEYLQWVGMKSTSSLLITESPVSFKKNNSQESEQPALYTLFDNLAKGVHTFKNVLAEDSCSEKSFECDSTSIAHDKKAVKSTTDEEFDSECDHDTISEPLEDSSAEDNTQDRTLFESDSEDLSSCEHVVNLK